jgi:ATP-dependent DNA helicase RecG
MPLFNRKDRTKFRKAFINPLVEEDFLTMTLPGKPKSSKQKYIITERGKEFLEYLKKKEK